MCKWHDELWRAKDLSTETINIYFFRSKFIARDAIVVNLQFNYAHISHLFFRIRQKCVKKFTCLKIGLVSFCLVASA